MTNNRRLLAVCLLGAVCNVWWQPSTGQMNDPTEECSAISKTVKVYISTQKTSNGEWVTSVQLHVFPGGAGNNDTLMLSSDSSVKPWTIRLQQKSTDCDANTTPFSLLQMDIPGPIADGYELITGVGYYKFHSTPTIWGDAKKVCETEGAHLAIINSQEEHDALHQLFLRHPNLTGVYDPLVAAIGFHDQLVEGEYITIFGEPLAGTGYDKWSPYYSSPDNFRGDDLQPGEDCGSIYLTDGNLNDVSCDEKIAFICEKEVVRANIAETRCLPYRP